MRIGFIELVNFRKLKATRIEFAEHQTLFVGSNNSGKTSAMIALRLFLKERGGFTTRDVTLSNWRAINLLGETWLRMAPDEVPDAQALIKLLPALDVWFEVEDSELHYVSHLIPILDWTGGKVGVRLRFEPKDIESLVSEYRDARQKATAQLSDYRIRQSDAAKGFELWPGSLHDYFERRFGSALTLRAYKLDPQMIAEIPPNNVPAPQALPTTEQPLDGDPLARLILIREIPAQRGFRDAAPVARESDDDSLSNVRSGKARLSEQLRAYYRRHLDPANEPSDDDVSALSAFHRAQQAFDEKLAEGFKHAVKELETLGYPGIANPRLKISTRIAPTDALNHPSAVQYALTERDGEDVHPIMLPEDYNGLGFQNLISMVFLLMRFRDDWMRFGKLGQLAAPSEQQAIEPLQLVLVEEPEAHLHAQVQQVFIRKAYDVLRNREDLGTKTIFRTQLVVSTHSSHIAHEVEFACLRYFRRLPAAGLQNVPSSVVANLSTVFGDTSETARFVSRYLRTTHCDLFFADGVILIEGAAERILIPHFIRDRYAVLAAHYVSILEIGGSHAHRLRRLVQLLGIPTLIITDLDAVDGTSRKAVRPKRGTGLKTANPVLGSWLPGKEDLDALLEPEADRTKIGEGHGVVRVSYQRAIEVTLPGGQAAESVIPSTFEDALVLSNPGTMNNIEGVAMTNAVAKIVREAKTAEELCEKLFDRLRKNAEKAGFALDILGSKKLEALVPPPYVAEGLAWLQEQMKVAEAAEAAALSGAGVAASAAEAAMS